VPRPRGFRAWSAWTACVHVAGGEHLGVVDLRFDEGRGIPGHPRPDGLSRWPRTRTAFEGQHLPERRIVVEVQEQHVGPLGRRRRARVRFMGGRSLHVCGSRRGPARPPAAACAPRRRSRGTPRARPGAAPAREGRHAGPGPPRYCRRRPRVTGPEWPPLPGGKRTAVAHEFLVDAVREEGESCARGNGGRNSLRSRGTRG
jgi:hypothetical protein